ncbi:NADH dehydrogenase [Clostridiaceae bacterium JG1575]|nr:NADH dehydrogenase [Clostridiaceae bacterium JG1575]
MKVVILGGVAAGTKVAAKLKRSCPDAEVLILTKGEDISYAGCGLPYYLSGAIEDKAQLIVNTPERFEGLTGATVRTGVAAIAMDPEAKTVTIEQGSTKEQEVVSYDELVIATGADALRPPVPGMDLPGVYTLRTPADAIALRNAVGQGALRRVTVVGGGFIGLETAENLCAKGIRCTVIDMAPQILPGFDPEVAAYIEDHLAQEGIMVFTGTKLLALEGEDRVEKVVTDRRPMKCDAVVMAAGIRANTAFTKDSGLKLLPNRTIEVNEYLETNLPHVYALGDCATVKNRLTQEAAWAPMGSSANMEGRLLAQTLSGKDKESFPGVLGTMVIRLPNLNAGKTGLSYTQAKERYEDAVAITCVVDDKAHYYPGASHFIIKMVADKASDRLLGLQVLGRGAVDKIVDIAVTALSLHAKLSDLEDMDLAYAPPFSTAIHPFTHAVNILRNKMEGTLSSMTPQEFQDLKEEERAGLTILDAAPAPNLSDARYINLTEVLGSIGDLDPNGRYLLVCQKGKRAYLLQNRLRHYGYEHTKVLEGGTTFNNLKNE